MPVSTPTPTTTAAKAIASTWTPSGKRAARPVVHTVPIASGGRTAASARTRRNVSTNASDASTPDSVALCTRSARSICSVAQAMAWPPASSTVTPGWPCAATVRARSKSSTTARASFDTNALPRGCASTRRARPSSATNASPGAAPTPAASSACDSQGTTARRSGSRASQASTSASIAGASSIARVSSSRARIPSGVRIAASRARACGPAKAHASVGSLDRRSPSLGARSRTCAMEGASRSDAATASVTSSTSRGSAPRTRTTDGSRPPKARVHRTRAAASPRSGKSVDRSPETRSLDAVSHEHATVTATRTTRSSHRPVMRRRSLPGRPAAPSPCGPRRGGASRGVARSR